MATKTARSRASSPRIRFRGSGVIADLLVPRFPNLGTLLPDGLDRISPGARHPGGHHRPDACVCNCQLQTPPPFAGSSWSPLSLLPPKPFAPAGAALEDA